jgi:Uma2 family endonuclease
LLPEDGKLYEIIAGELHVSRQPHYYHQRVCGNILTLLETWNKQTGTGEASFAPGLIFDDDDDVAPDVVWISAARLAGSLEDDGKLHTAPELVVEVLLPGARQERRDREAKLKLYSRRGVQEYWIADWRSRQLEVYRREQTELGLTGTFFEGDALTTPLLPDFSIKVSEFFEGIPAR